ncbi:Homeobox domain [Macleaya cordata]|uniref:Homeobox-leucine zipper protein n=1 Tax=Macleaya cordata TaxID=56857 RepID=A0A200Q266_MACCD|nr:Homeobox domain [Macleaya cordata]
MDEIDDQMFLISQPNPTLYTQLVPGEEESRCRRRRKKNKIEANDVGFRKRKLTDEQVRLLELNFGNEHKLESERKDRIALELGLDPRQVAVWFQNRRVRWKTKRLEEEYSKLKMVHEGVIVEKCRLESEVSKLKEQLMDAEKEIHKLSERSNDANINSTGSPSSSSFSMEAGVGEFGVNGFENFFYVPEDNYVHGMEWVDLYGM